MDVKLGQLVFGKDDLAALAKEKTRGSVAIKISRALRKVGEELGDFDSKRLELFTKYGILDEEKKQYEIKDPENLAAFKLEYEEMLDVMIPLDIIPLTQDDLDKLDCTGEMLAKLDWFVQS